MKTTIKYYNDGKCILIDNRKNDPLSFYDLTETLRQCIALTGQRIRNAFAQQRDENGKIYNQTTI